jgi:glutamate racemase
MIGFFDSGIGGLGIWLAVRRRLPEVSTRSVADQAYCPYGSKSSEEIVERGRRISQWLIDEGCTMIVVACNTATVNAIEVLRKEFDVPFVGTEPGIKPAQLASRTGMIAVLATARTIGRYEETPDVQLLTAPGLVEEIEKLEWERNTKLLAILEGVKRRLAPDVDTLVLGSTHFILIEEVVRGVLGKRLTLINTNDAVAQQVERVSQAVALDRRNQHAWITTGSSDATLQRLKDTWPCEEVTVEAVRI